MDAFSPFCSSHPEAKRSSGKGQEERRSLCSSNDLGAISCRSESSRLGSCGPAGEDEYFQVSGRYDAPHECPRPPPQDPYHQIVRRAYRAFYILNWIYRYFTEPHYVHWITWISGLVQTLLYADFSTTTLIVGRTMSSSIYPHKFLLYFKATYDGF